MLFIMARSPMYINQTTTIDDIIPDYTALISADTHQIQSHQKIFYHNSFRIRKNKGSEYSFLSQVTRLISFLFHERNFEKIFNDFFVSIF